MIYVTLARYSKSVFVISGTRSRSHRETIHLTLSLSLFCNDLYNYVHVSCTSNSFLLTYANLAELVWHRLWCLMIASKEALPVSYSQVTNPCFWISDTQLLRPHYINSQLNIPFFAKRIARWFHTLTLAISLAFQDLRPNLPVLSSYFVLARASVHSLQLDQCDKWEPFSLRKYTWLRW